MVPVGGPGGSAAQGPGRVGAAGAELGEKAAGAWLWLGTYLGQSADCSQVAGGADSVQGVVSSAEFGLGARGRGSQPAGAGVVRDLSAGHPR